VPGLCSILFLHKMFQLGCQSPVHIYHILLLCSLFVETFTVNSCLTTECVSSNCDDKLNDLTELELGSSREAAGCAAVQQLISILWSPNVHYHVHRNPSMVPILSQTNPAHITPHCFCKINCNSIHPPNVLFFLVVSFLLVFPTISSIHTTCPALSAILTWSL
jgi:hypothetical protein